MFLENLNLEIVYLFLSKATIFLMLISSDFRHQLAYPAKKESDTVTAWMRGF